LSCSARWMQSRKESDRVLAGGLVIWAEAAVAQRASPKRVRRRISSQSCAAQRVRSMPFGHSEAAGGLEKLSWLGHGACLRNKAALARAHSKTWRILPSFLCARSVLECGRASAAFPWAPSVWI
jgi:hypothetical protein